MDCTLHSSGWYVVIGTAEGWAQFLSEMGQPAEIWEPVQWQDEILVGALLAASTGVVGASVVAMGVISLPVMLKNGYDPRLACGSICGAGTLGQIIPPSIVLIILVVVAANRVGENLTCRCVGAGDHEGVVRPRSADRARHEDASSQSSSGRITSSIPAASRSGSSPINSRFWS